jgi:hypothetical protein
MTVNKSFIWRFGAHQIARDHHWPFKDFKKRNIQFAKFPRPNWLCLGGEGQDHWESTSASKNGPE